jgi:tetratricopeptide (TPR) repeat protein
MQTLTLANIYELQGLKEEALEIYKELLKKDKNNTEVSWYLGNSGSAGEGAMQINGNMFCWCFNGRSWLESTG